MNDDTICAVSTPAGRGGIAVIRISGSNAEKAVSRIWKGKPLKDMISHTAHLGTIMDGDNPLDDAVLIYFRAPHSFTGEDVIELSVHGSSYIQRRLLQQLTLNAEVCRIAQRGEFTRRAFINGKLDLAQAEAIGDIISSNSTGAHRLAIRQLRGGLSEKISQLANQLINFASLLELELDFSEEDVEFASRDELIQTCVFIEELLERLARSYATGRSTMEGLPVVIVGQPNAGKSTLLNELLDENKAIVSDIPGTTRDIIEDTVEIENVLFRFIDTAGLRSNTSDKIELIGIQRATKRIENASIILLILDSSTNIDNQLQSLKEFISHLNNQDTVIMPVLNKCDLGTNIKTSELNILLHGLFPKLKITGAIEHSSKDPATLESLRKELSSIAQDILSINNGEDPILTNSRHFESIQRSLTSLKEVRQGLSNGMTPDLIAQPLRSAINSLNEITGSITTPDILSNIFSHFCIGK